TLLCVVPPVDFQHWAAVQELMREETLEEARAKLEGFAARVHSIAGLAPEVVIREGKAQDEITTLINQDKSISLLVLGAANEENPGPLVSAFSGPLLRTLRVPVLFVPGILSDDAIDKLV